MLIPATLPLAPDAELRLVTHDDADRLGTLIEANLDHLRPWMPWAHGYDRVSTRAFIEAADRQARMDQGGQFLILRDRRAAGTIGFHAINWANRSTSIGYWLAADAQGLGLATAAVRVLTAHAFSVWGLHRIELRAQPSNARSRAVAERCGFTEEGLAREAEFVGGSFHDLVIYSLLATDI